MEQQKKKKRAVAFGLVAVVLIFWNLMQNTADQQKLKVACIGDELTFGTAVEEREDNCYPVQLQKYMEQAEKKYRIGNFGVEGAAVQKKSKKPYTKEERYESSMEYKADLVVMMLGTNDTTEENWTDIDTFQKDYQSLPFTPSPKIFQVQKEAEKWGEMMGVSVVGELNEKISKGKMQELLLISEALQEGRISKIAEQIIERGGVKFVMIAGPSSSGKTTFSHRLSIQLAAHGMKPHPIAVDNYFVNREDTPRDENGNYNYECLEAIDVELFNRDMNALLKGERVELPRFNFKLGKREYKGDFLKMQPNDILVIEGIHGLNDRLSYSLPTESKFKIYISALTQLNIDEHNRIPTTDGRLIRRIVRDNRTRGTSAKATIAMWPSVRRGEDENIFPYQEQADAMFNSALLYELAVLKLYAEPVLFQIGSDEPEYQEAKRLLKFLDYFVGIPSEDIPKNSILREFVGGSCFDV